MVAGVDLRTAAAVAAAASAVEVVAVASATTGRKANAPVDHLAASCTKKVGAASAVDMEVEDTAASAAAAASLEGPVLAAASVAASAVDVGTVDKVNKETDMQGGATADPLRKVAAASVAVATLPRSVFPATDIAPMVLRPRLPDGEAVWLKA
mmetsp:Transcript_15009/g.37470  ORF Transcript_15009/g.37470 Transcript_15009/m.37470 type:complete len:153 (+) Transcript_15009:426-884(+)